MAAKKAASTTYHVLIGFDYKSAIDGEWHRVEPGDTVSDFPAGDETWLLDQQAISLDAPVNETPADPTPEPLAEPLPALDGTIEPDPAPVDQTQEV